MDLLNFVCILRHIYFGCGIFFKLHKLVKHPLLELNIYDVEEIPTPNFMSLDKMQMK